MSNKLEKRTRIINKPVLQRCRDLIWKIVPGATVILYGSRARGNADPESDYDLLVLVKGYVNWQLEERIREELYPLELETGIAFSLVVFSEEDWNTPLYRAMPFSRNVRQEGIIL
ncbi:MAG: nucleotidyltransferase domain-containing protein [Peptococcaceae bacterium]|nr:nucleotidyltransferase domain-containing protein [Peptococcaceae bacterium]